MMLSKLTLCAAALLIGQTQAEEPKPQPQTEQQAAQPAEQQTSTPANEPEVVDEEKEVAPLPGQPLPEPAKTAEGEQSDAVAPELEEKEVDGIRLQAIEANIVSYTNTERARHGLPPLKVDENLMKTAREHAAWMTKNRSMTHTWRSVAENIAMGQPHSRDVVRAWMNSSGHRANILNSGHGRIGVAAFRTATGTIFWCQQFTR